MYKLVAISLLSLVLCGCNFGDKDNVTYAPGVTFGTETITGTVFYRERILLPAEAEISVILEDISRADVKAMVVSKSTMKIGTTSPPWKFELQYDPTKIIDRNRYALRAKIELNGRLLFMNMDHIPAFSDQAKMPFEILVSRVGGTKQPPQEVKVPVVTPNVELTENYWKLTEINGKKAVLGESDKELNMVLTAEGNNIRGFSGCNRFTGSYEVKDNQLKIGPLAVTRKACADGMDQELLFLDALEKAERFIITGKKLEIYDAEEKLILSFESVRLQ